MQEDIEMRTVTLAINSSKFTGRILKDAISKLLANRKGKSQEAVVSHGKQSVKQLIAQNQGVSNIEINDPDIRAFTRIAQKYGVDFAVKKVKSSPPKYLVFFKARDADALTAAFTEFTNKRVRQQSRPSLRKKLSMLRTQMENHAPVKEKKKEISR